MIAIHKFPGMAESTGMEWSVRSQRNRSEVPPAPQHHRRHGRRKHRHPAEESSFSPRPLRVTLTRLGRKSSRRRERAVHGSDSTVQELPRIRSSSAGQPRASGRETCIDLTTDTTLSPTVAVVDLTETPVQRRKREPQRRESSDVEITGTGKTNKTPPAKSFVRCPVCLEMGSEFSAAGRDIVSTKCGHVFCDLCLRQAIEDSKKCPTCRTSLKMKDFHKIYL